MTPEQLAALLGEHRHILAGWKHGRAVVGCQCGDELQEDEHGDARAAHERHVAELVLARITPLEGALW